MIDDKIDSKQKTAIIGNMRKLKGDEKAVKKTKTAKRRVMMVRPKLHGASTMYVDQLKSSFGTSIGKSPIRNSVAINQNNLLQVDNLDPSVSLHDSDTVTDTPVGDSSEIDPKSESEKSFN